MKVISQAYIILLALALVLLGCVSNQENKITHKKIYYSNGKVQTITPYLKGLPHGVMLEYYEGGTLRREIPYHEGKVLGEVKQYYPNGKLFSITPQVDGKIDGIVKKYHENGVILSETIYSDNEVQPGLKEYDQQGKLREPYRLVFSEKIIKRMNDVLVVLEISISPPISRVKFSQLVQSDETKGTFAPIALNGKTGTLTFVLLNDSTIDKELIIKADFVTRYHNRGKVIQNYHLNLKK